MTKENTGGEKQTTIIQKCDRNCVIKPFSAHFYLLLLNLNIWNVKKKIIATHGMIFNLHIYGIKIIS